MQQLIETLEPFDICLSGQIYHHESEAIISKDKFLECYLAYLEGIKSGKLLEEALYRPFFSSVFTKDLSALYQVKISDEAFLLKAAKPVLQLQAHRMHYSKQEQKFRPMIFGAESIHWGIQFSYPQLFQDNCTKEILSVLKADFINNQLYHKLQVWIRKNTIPTPFIDNFKRINATVRIGRSCLSWINQHPQLIERGLKVYDDD
ncbi:MAG TPA: hypothetical protein PLC42_03610 [Parachlamydiaceae bacterium]|nr:hypothetical protein [Parachlamydiaceae bacterium]